MPAAWAAPPLLTELADDTLPPVWPHPSGSRRGIALEPLHPSVPELALIDEELGQRLALVDAMPANGKLLGFENPWQAAALPHAARHTLPSGAEIRVITPPYLVATKLAAFAGRRLRMLAAGL